MLHSRRRMRVRRPNASAPCGIASAPCGIATCVAGGSSAELGREKSRTKMRLVQLKGLHRSIFRPIFPRTVRREDHRKGNPDGIATCATERFFCTVPSPAIFGGDVPFGSSHAMRCDLQGVDCPYDSIAGVTTVRQPSFPAVDERGRGSSVRPSVAHHGQSWGAYGTEAQPH